MLTSKAPGRALIPFSLLLFPSWTPCRAQPQRALVTDARVGIILGNAPAATDEPTNAQTARCLKGFELYRNGTVNKLLVTGGFTVGYISEARMVKIALVSLGVPAANLKVAGRGEYRRLTALAAAYADKSATVLTTAKAAGSTAPGVAPKWKFVFID